MALSSLRENTPAEMVSNRLAYLLLTLCGLSFLFFTGFPFGNHNESYAWLVILDKTSFIQSLTTRFAPVQSFRPLGTATAWLTYNLTGGIYLQQLVNWAFAAFSFALLFKHAPNKPVFGVAAFLATAGFFSGYIYLFHLHGVFYGPLQLYIALLTCIAFKKSELTSRQLAGLFAVTVIAALYHTFALLVFAAFLAGSVLQVPKKAWKKKLPVLGVFLILSLVLMYAILSMYHSKAEGDVAKGTLASFTTTELNSGLRLLSLLFAIVTVATTPIYGYLKKWYALVMLLAVAASVYLHLPFLLLWIAASILKSICIRNWPLAAIIFSTAVFPVATHTGTPTYIVFVIMVCMFVTTLNITRFIQLPAVFGKLIFAFVILLAGLLVVQKWGKTVPGVTKGLKPILAEQEKTLQLERILNWKKNTAAFAKQPIHFFDESSKPSLSATAINRQYRPPTQQKYLDRYLNGGNSVNAEDTTAAPLLVTFGGKKLNDHRLVFEVRGRSNGNAYVYQ